MSEMAKTRMMCQYCDHSWAWADVPKEFECPDCNIPLTDQEVRYIGKEIECRGGFFERTEATHYPNTKIPSSQARREKAFYEEWNDEHKRSDLLQMLVKPVLRKDPQISDRERYIVNTVIQWLGTNVGFGFVCAALKKAGYRVEKMEDSEC